MAGGITFDSVSLHLHDAPAAALPEQSAANEVLRDGQSATIDVTLAGKPVEVHEVTDQHGTRLHLAPGVGPGRLGHLEPQPHRPDLDHVPVGIAPCDRAADHRRVGDAEMKEVLPDRRRRHTGSGKDGADLYAEAFGTSAGAPAVPINAFGTESEKSEHKGFLTMLTGIHAHYRNPRAHSTRLGSEEDRQDFFDAFALFSYVHRRLDAAGVQP